MSQNDIRTQDMMPAAVLANNNDDDYIDLTEIFFAILHRWKAVSLAFLIGCTIMMAYHTYVIKPTYCATTQLYITSSDSVISLQDLQVGSALTSDYQSIITSRGVLNKVIDDLKLSTDYKGLRKLIKVSTPNGTHIISTSVTSTDLALSRDIANDLLNVSIDRIYQIVGTSEPTIIDFSEAEAVEDVTPSMVKYMIIGGLLGILAAAAYIVIKVMMDKSLKSDEDIKKYLDLPVLSAIPYYRDE